MKLKLSIQQGVAVLDVLEDVDVGNVSVLKAGFAKLLQSGKARIVLNLTAATKVTPDFVGEILKLHNIVAPQGGALAVAGQSDLVKTVLQKMQPPPPVQIYATVDVAIRVFAQAPAAKPGVAPAAGAPAGAARPATAAGKPAVAVPEEPLPNIDPNDPNRELKLELAKLERENRVYKAKLQSLSLEEIRKLRFENGVFERQLRAMEEQVHSLRKERKKRYMDQVLHTKIGQLELVLEDFLVKEMLLGKK